MISETMQRIYTKNKKIALFDACQYTTIGFASLCDDYPYWKITGIARSLTQLIDLLTKNKADMLICGVGSNPGDILLTLHILNYPFKKCILLTERNYSVLYKIFMTAGFYDVISKEKPLKQICGILHNGLGNNSKCESEKINIQTHPPLERYIISALLKGIKPDDISNMLGISYRSVSKYKQSALRRSGVKSLNEILLYKNTL